MPRNHTTYAISDDDGLHVVLIIEQGGASAWLQYWFKGRTAPRGQGRKVLLDLLSLALTRADLSPSAPVKAWTQYPHDNGDLYRRIGFILMHEGSVGGKGMTIYHPSAIELIEALQTSLNVIYSTTTPGSAIGTGSRA